MTALSSKMVTNFNTTTGCTFVVMAFENIATAKPTRTERTFIRGFTSIYKQIELVKSVPEKCGKGITYDVRDGGANALRDDTSFHRTCKASYHRSLALVHKLHQEKNDLQSTLAEHLVFLVDLLPGEEPVGNSEAAAAVDLVATYLEDYGRLVAMKFAEDLADAHGDEA
jgi:hypothetical protein